MLPGSIRDFFPGVRSALLDQSHLSCAAERTRRIHDNGTGGTVCAAFGIRPEVAAPLRCQRSARTGCRLSLSASSPPMLIPTSTADRALSSKQVDPASRAASQDRNPRRSATQACGLRRLCEPDRKVLCHAVGRRALPREPVGNLWSAPFHRRTLGAGYTVQRSETTRRDGLRGSWPSFPTPMAVPAMGFDHLADVASLPSTLAGAWGANPPLSRPDLRRRPLHHPGSKRGNEGYDAVRQLPSTCG